MAFDPNQVTYPVAALQHIFSRHGDDWGFGGLNWNNANAALLQQVIVQFLANTPTVYAGTYRGGDAWLVVEQNAPHKCLIVYRTGYEIWSGWKLSAAQFNYATNPPFSLGGGGLLVFGKTLEEILEAKDHESLDKLAQKFLDTYKAHGDERYDEVVEKTLMDCFAVLDNYVPPHMAKQRADSYGITSDLNEVKKVARQTLATLEKLS